MGFSSTRFAATQQVEKAIVCHYTCAPQQYCPLLDGNKWRIKKFVLTYGDAAFDR